ncbi:MAG: MBL fold metallo-hydrolase, partial [Dehalococcoidia bacterium]|nr:MBL fold metallo-hydrolase [Dehalococcoidia bacterium]
MAGKSIRWLGHATFIINTPGGKTIVTDPWIEGNPSCPISLGDIKQ